nr:DUF4214 domain-containing protein [uncultured Campylobacter sp.]
MALTTTQINQAYIAILGRAAIGTESRVAGDASVSSVATSLIADLAKASNGDKGIFATLADKVLADGNGLNNSDFVESLYLTLLNRDTENDAEGKAFWLSVLNNGASREDLVASFTNAIIAQKAANSQDYQSYAAQVSVQSDNFVESLYTKLLGRSSDEAGKAYWSSVIADGASYADVAASFAAAAFSQGKGTDDGVAIANKLDVANYATTSITAFSKLATDQNIEDVKARIEQAIASTDKDSTAETIAESKKAIDSDANTFQAPGSVAFTRSDDKLGIDANGDYSTTKATDFNGSLNLTDPTKGTIQAADKVYGNIEFADGNILTVNVTGTTTQKTLNLATALPGTISGVNNLEIKAGTAQVSGDISTKFTNTVTINAGYTGENNDQNASTITVAHKLDTYNAGAKADQLTVASTGSLKNINMGAGNDTIILASGASVTNIDAGAGNNDTLQLATASAAVNYGIKSITGVEVIKLTGAGDADSGAQISYDAIKETNKAFSLTSDNEGSGSLTITAGDNKDIDVSKITNGVYNKDTSAYEKKVASLTINDVKQGATIRLDSAVDGNNLKDKIVLQDAVANGNLGATVINFAKGDTLDTTTASNHFTDKISTYAGGDASGDLSGAIAGVNSVKVSANGVLTFFSEASGSGSEITTGLTIDNVQDIIVATAGSNKIFNAQTKKAVIVQLGKDAYIIDTGANASVKTDDVVIKLSGVIIDGTDITGISVTSNAVTLA